MATAQCKVWAPTELCAVFSLNNQQERLVGFEGEHPNGVQDQQYPKEKYPKEKYTKEKYPKEKYPKEEHEQDPAKPLQPKEVSSTGKSSKENTLPRSISIPEGGASLLEQAMKRREEPSKGVYARHIACVRLVHSSTGMMCTPSPSCEPSC